MLSRPDKRGYRHVGIKGKPVSGKRGGLNGSMHHLLQVFLRESGTLISFAGANSNKTKALFTF